MVENTICGQSRLVCRGSTAEPKSDGIKGLLDTSYFGRFYENGLFGKYVPRKSGVKSCALLPSQMGTNALLLLLLYQTNNI